MTYRAPPYIAKKPQSSQKINEVPTPQVPGQPCISSRLHYDTREGFDLTQTGTLFNHVQGQGSDSHKDGGWASNQREADCSSKKKKKKKKRIANWELLWWKKKNVAQLSCSHWRHVHIMPPCQYVIQARSTNTSQLTSHQKVNNVFVCIILYLMLKRNCSRQNRSSRSIHYYALPNVSKLCTVWHTLSEFRNGGALSAGQKSSYSGYFWTL